MNVDKKIFGIFSSLLFGVILLGGCETPATSKGHPFDKGAAVVTEPEWIRNGEPVEFEGQLWFPADSIENLLDSEVYRVGEYKGVSIFIEMTDVRSYERLYTKFGKRKYRFFEREGKRD